VIFSKRGLLTTYVLILIFKMKDEIIKKMVFH
jgi:hypothetical protein